MSIEAMKQAVEAWDAYDGGTLDHPMSDAMEALRAAVDAKLEQAMVEVWQTAPRPWVGLSVNEARDFYESKLSRAELINKIDEFLEEKNSG